MKNKKVKLETLLKAGKYLEYQDILLALFNSQDLVTEKQINKALNKHLKREV